MRAHPLHLVLAASLGVAFAVPLACSPSGEDTLELIASPNSIQPTGEETTLKVTATDRTGQIGKGKVKVTSAAGSLVDGVNLDLDTYGRAEAQFSCDAGQDSHCKNSVRVVAEWPVHGKTITAEASVKISATPVNMDWVVDWHDGGSTTACNLVIDGGTPSACSGSCPRGFSCVGGLCQLNGAGGGLQFTLRFPVSDDIDLHVLEPLKDGGTCEIFWANPNRTPGLGCGANASLDLDSNAGCNIDNVNIENVIYPGGMPTFGTYIARVDFWKNCSSTGPGPVLYELKVRAGNSVRYYCGSFAPNSADQGGAGSGVTVTTVTIPPQ